ncbi:MAG TPA: hypothetical protein PKE69_23895, partial [Pyrinomonadaceae bacterium]|nr:hypothetical protein [Pyrinomonadaceae bacterium]
NWATRNLLREARKQIASAGAEFGFAESAKKSALFEIAEWHQRRGIEKIQVAVSYFRRAERCALSAKYRKFAVQQIKNYERFLQSNRINTQTGNETRETATKTRFCPQTLT